MSARWPAPARRVLAAVLRPLGMLLAFALAGLAGWLDRVSPPSSCHHQMVPADVPAPSPLAAVSEAMDEAGGLVADAPVPAPPPRAAQEAMAVTPPDGMATLPWPVSPTPGPGQPPLFATRHDGMISVSRSGALRVLPGATLLAPVMLRDTGQLAALAVMEPDAPPVVDGPLVRRYFLAYEAGLAA